MALPAAGAAFPDDQTAPPQGEDDDQVAPIPDGYAQRPGGRNIAGPGDYGVREKVVRVLARDPEIAAQPYRLILVNGGAVFSGQMGTLALKMRALRTAASIRGVINVTDEMRVAPSDAGDAGLRDAVGGLLSDATEELGLRDLRVECEGGVVTLTGTVRDYPARIRAEDLAGAVAGVTRVANRLRAADAPAGTDDGSLRRAVAAYLGDFRRYPYPAEIQVQVDGGVATLTGRVNLFIGRVLAGNMAAQVGGVVRVDNRIKVDPSLGPVRTTVKALP
jgi:osmotically-inducible protein OsmY